MAQLAYGLAGGGGYTALNFSMLCDQLLSAAGHKQVAQEHTGVALN
jgi:hypothetical protein